MNGAVHEAAGGVYRVVLEDGTSVDASLRGRLKQQQRTGMQVVIGDAVTVEQIGDAWAIKDVAERQTELVRRGRGGRAANCSLRISIQSSQSCPQGTLTCPSSW